MVNKSKKFITIHKGEKSSPQRTDFVSIILLSENHGYRMKSYGPTPLIEIRGKSLIETQINAIQASFSNFEIILCSGFETEKIVNFIKEKFEDINIRVVENQVHLNSNCCESARLCINNVTNNKVIFCGGGVLLTPEYLRLIDLKKSMLICEHDSSSFEVGVIQNNNYLEGLSIGVKNQYWTELLYLSDKKIIRSLYTILSKPEYKNRFIFEAINEMPNKHKIIVKKNEQEPIVKINNIKILKRMTT